MHGRHPSAQLLQYDDFYCLIDCGEGTQERMIDAGIRTFKIKHILISHLHGDHVFGLPGLLSSYAHLKRTEPLTVFGPVGIQGLLDSIFRYTELTLTYPLTIIEKVPTSLVSIANEGNIEILTFPLYHRIACNGYLIREKVAHNNLDKEKIRNEHLTIGQIQSLKRGEDIRVDGMLVSYENYLCKPSYVISYAYCSDTRFDMRIVSWIKGVKVLYHETTFMNDMESMAEITGHSTSGEAGRIASEAGVTCLITGHYSSRYKDVGLLVAEAGAHFGFVLQAEEGKKYNLRAISKGLTDRVKG
jgi:ribonuclease Z